MIFIRPLLLILLLVPLILKFTGHYLEKASPWTKWVDRKLLPYLLIASQKQHHSFFGKKYLTFLWCALVIAAAGPAFEKLPVPVSHDLPNTVFIMDLGPAMQGSTLASAKIKMHDFLTTLKDNRVGLVLYDDKGYTALPLTQDRALLRAIIPTLDPSVLPSQGQNLGAAFQKADQLIQQAGGKGRILYLTAGGVKAPSMHIPYPVGVLGFDDAAISPNIKKMGTYRAKTVDASDIFALLKATETDTTVQIDTQEQADASADLGALLVLILLPFVAFTFRKGFLFLFILGYLVPAHASFFLRPDQKSYQQHQQAVQDYRSGAFEKAIQGFQNHFYNLGNALAHAGKIQEAIQAYTQALKENPHDEDARFNKEYLEKQLPPPESKSQNQKDQDQSNANQQEQQSDQNQQDSDKPQDQTNEQESDQTQSQSSEEREEVNPQSNSEQQQENTTQIQPQEVDEQDREQSPFNQQEQQILNKLRSDPYRVLRYRLQQQARQK